MKDNEYIPLKKRSFFGRVRRLPKHWKANWEFASNCSFIERVQFCVEMVKVVMK